MRSPERAFIVVTHYQRLLNYIVPDFVHVLSDGLLVRSGGRELALELEEKGYGWLEAPRLGSGQAAAAGREASNGVLGPGAPRRGGRRLCEDRLPNTRKEEWRFTNVAPIADDRFVLADGPPANAADAGRRRRHSRIAAAGDRQRRVRAGAVGSRPSAEGRAHWQPARRRARWRAGLAEHLASDLRHRDASVCRAQHRVPR